MAGVSVFERRSTRLVGVDVARCLALLGMIATHVAVARDPDGSLSTLQWIAGGRASALFAVLAGVSLAIISGRRTPVAGAARGRLSLAIVVRAVALVMIGLALAELGTGIAVILAYYGVLFVLALPFLGLGARALLVLAVAWACVLPVVSHVVRPLLPDRQFANPDLDQLAAPGRLAAELLLTGYYPALPWVAYVLLGLGLGRLDLTRPVIQARIAAAGLVVAAGTTVASGFLARRAGFTDVELDAVAGGMFGQTPTDDWSWLLLVAPHSTTPFDLLQTGGSAAAVLGLCLLVVGRLRAVAPDAERAVAIIFGAGTMTLTLYVLHVVLRETLVTPEDDQALLWHVVIVLWVGGLFVALRRRGPLEWLVGLVPDLLRGSRS
ncbi:heparan-alpha-glucosaminide N-acetyltransferase domain-containing protein [Nocardioides sp.]|uniref:heparan-alpha-glucosaminide N-acetyltransferase domain-containing protein n=1 Tax=Nocardioides sp. TaxID=35761 RepID=UPI002B26B889|nr:heparan-alpha-glucosaminide N-acetyltransferase domain-containing protein [Nocardioides sp.]